MAFRGQVRPKAEKSILEGIAQTTLSLKEIYPPEEIKFHTLLMGLFAHHSPERSGLMSRPLALEVGIDENE